MYNTESYELFQEPGILVIMKVVRHRWAGHVITTSVSQMSERIMNYNLEGKQQ